MKQWLIYKHTSIKSGKSYIGLTLKTMEVRWRQHVTSAKLCKDNYHFQRAIVLYGEDNWVHEVVGILSLN